MRPCTIQLPPASARRRKENEEKSKKYMREYTRQWRKSREEMDRLILARTKVELVPLGEIGDAEEEELLHMARIFFAASSNYKGLSRASADEVEEAREWWNARVGDWQLFKELGYEGAAALLRYTIKKQWKVRRRQLVKGKEGELSFREMRKLKKEGKLTQAF